MFLAFAVSAQFVLLSLIHIYVIMAAGAFVQGSSIELSADGPIKPPYAVYFQGGLTWYHAKLGILKSLQSMIDAGVLPVQNIRELTEKES